MYIMYMYMWYLYMGHLVLRGAKKGLAITINNEGASLDEILGRHG